MNRNGLNPVERLAAEATLRANPALEGLSDGILSLLLAAAEWKRIPAGERLFSAGETTAAVQVVASGFFAFETAIAIPDLPIIDINRAPIWLIGQPQVNGQIRMTTVTARTTLIVAQISHTRFEALSAREPVLKDFKARVVVGLFWHTLEALTDALIPDNRHRTISTLLRIAGRKQAGDTAVAVPISQTELSALTNLSRQTCGKLLREFEADDLVRLSYREIEVLRPDLLRGLIA